MISKKYIIGRARLLKLALFLWFKVKDEWFDLNNWVNSPNNPDDDIAVQAGDFQAHTCGTTACAIGWCLQIFPDLVKVSKHGVQNFILGKSKQASGYTVGMDLFDLTNGQSHYLFDPCQYKGRDGNRKDVVKRIFLVLLSDVEPIGY